MMLMMMIMSNMKKRKTLVFSFLLLFLELPTPRVSRFNLGLYLNLSTPSWALVRWLLRAAELLSLLRMLFFISIIALMMEMAAPGADSERESRAASRAR